MVTEKKSSNSNTNNDSLHKVVRGTGLIIISLLLSSIFIFTRTILIARAWSEYYVGIFSLGITVVNLCMTISSLGMNQGVVRSIAHSKGKNELDKIPHFIVTSVFLSFVASVITGLIVFAFSEFIAVNIFSEPSIILPLKIIAISIPFNVVSLRIVSVFQGFEQIKPIAYFKNILESLLFLLFILITIALNLTFVYVFYSFLITSIVITIVLIIYSLIKSSSLSFFTIKSIFSPAAKELLMFSLPLLGTAMIGLIITWTDTIMIGTIKGASDVGFYHAVVPFAVFLFFPLNALLVSFIPVFSGLYAKGLINEIKRNYLIFTKWITILTFPLFIIFFLFPDLTIRVLIGPNYLPSVNVLRILSLAQIVNNFVGPCAASIVVFGETRFKMYATISAASLNIILNLLLIPPYSYIGAAIASSSTIIFINIINTLKLYSLSKIQPISQNLVKPILFSMLFIIPIYFLSQHFLTYNLWFLILLSIVLYLIYLPSILITKSLDKDDVNMLIEIERKTGFKVKRIKKFLSKFVN
jgi:O-antigen/teichoic acid export membrane protein